MTEHLKEALRQGQQLSEMLDRASALCEARRTSKDRVLHWLQDSFVFQQKQNTVQNLVFNVPRGYDFEASRFNCYLEVRIVSVTDPNLSEKAFAPSVWFPSVADQFALIGIKDAADAVVEFTYTSTEGKTRRYQNAAFWVAQAFSDYTNVNGFSAGLSYARAESPSSLVFDPFYRLERGSTLTCRITPVYSTPCEIAPPLVDVAAVVYEYRIRGVLEGYKRL